MTTITVVSDLPKDEICKKVDGKLIGRRVAKKRLNEDNNFFIPNKKIFLDGVACLGKTTILQSLEMEMFVHFDEYTDFIKKLGISEKDYDKNVLQLLFTNYKKEKENAFGIHDRCSLSSIFYTIIALEMKNENVGKYIDCIVPEVKKFSENNILIFLTIKDFNSTKVKKLLSTMQKRNNGIDILSEAYIEAQQFVFGEIHRLCPAIIKFEVDLDDLDNSSSELRYLLKSIYYDKPLVKHCISNNNYFYDGGVNLHLENHLCMNPNEEIKVKVSEKLFIPPGWVGIIFARSSFHEYGRVENGVIDAFYIGDIYVTIKSDKPITLKKNSSICQIVFFRRDVSSVIEVNDVFKLPSVSRGSKGFGSTDCTL